MLIDGLFITEARGAGRITANYVTKSCGQEAHLTARDLEIGVAASRLDERLAMISAHLQLDVRMARNATDTTGSYDASSASVVAEAPQLYMRRYILAHELGHAVLHQLTTEGRASPAVMAAFEHEDAREAFCREFAVEITLPRSSLDGIRFSDLEKYLSEADAKFVVDLKRSGGPQFTFYHLTSLARACASPLIIVLNALHGHPMLSEADASLSVFRLSPNVYTHLEPGLRSWINACPAWGYIPSNRRVARMGFLRAQRALSEGKHGESSLAAEALTVSVRNVGDGPKWSTAVLNTICAYTPILGRGTSPYLFVAWRWPNSPTLS